MQTHWKLGRKTRHRRTASTTSLGAFTLVELLVVVSIIALLIAILLPSLKKAREQTRMVKCLSNLRAMGQGNQYYVQDQRGMLPGPLHPPVFRSTALREPEGGFMPMNPDTERPWFLLYRLAPYFAKHDSYLAFADEVGTCPTAAIKNPDENFLPDQQGNPSWSRPFHYLPNSWANTSPIYYFGWVNIGATWEGYVAGLNPNEDLYRTHTGGSGYYRPKPVDLVKRPADEWVIGDAWWWLVSVFTRPGRPQLLPVGTWQLPPPNPSDAFDSDGSSKNPLPHKPYHRGDTGTNLVFFDGHADTFTGTLEDWTRAFPANRKKE